MNLCALLDSCDHTVTGDTKDKEIEKLAYHSRDASAKSVFFALEGRDTDGSLYIPQAVSRGCTTIVAAEKSALTAQSAAACCRAQGIRPAGELTVITTGDVRAAMAAMAARFYGEPSRGLVVVGITGTKGKTTASYMLWRILEEAGLECGIIGTIASGFGGRLKESVNTTPQSVDLQRMLREMKDAGLKAVVMEVSSQGLMQKRTAQIDFDLAVFTNLSPDHIGRGEHESYEEYRYWKSCLFAGAGMALLNADDSECAYMARRSPPEHTYYFGRGDGCDFKLENIRLWSENGSLGTEYILNMKTAETGAGRLQPVRIGLPGVFNAYNAAAALSAASLLGVESEKAARVLTDIQIPGRTQIVPLQKDFTVMTDYAHNGRALASLLAALRDYGPHRLIVVFGCGGQRDKNRRREMGRAASRLADVIVVTSDNPRCEDPQAIIADITRHIAPGREVYVIEDRRRAIARALALAEEGDIVVVAGKGHETYQIIGREKKHFDDREEILQLAGTMPAKGE